MEENEQIQSFPAPKEISVKKAFSIVGLGLSLSLILVNLVQFGLVQVVARWLPDFYRSDFFTFGISTIPLILVALPAFWLVIRRLPIQKPTCQSKLTIGTFVKLFLVGYLVMMLLNLVSQALNLLIMLLTGANAANPLEFITEVNIWYTLLFGVILSPIVEEVMFRWLIISRLSRYGAGAAIFTSAFAFALYHGNLYQMLYAFALGFGFAAVTYHTGKLRYAILLHILMNLFGAVLFPQGALSGIPILQVLTVFFMFGIIIAGFVFGVLALCKINTVSWRQSILPRSYVRPFFLNLGILTYVALVLVIVVIMLVV